MRPGALTDLLRRVAASPEEPEAAAPPLLPGTMIGRFEILRELGRGGFGVVYEAKDRELGRQVALKLVRPGRAVVEEGKVAREAEAIARLSHPNLVTLHDVGHAEHGPYLVFEFLRGRTLQERLDDGPLPVQEAVHVAVEVARGLAHAHGEGVIHRDLKPANVFVTNKGQVKILDFGMAHAFGRRRLSGGTPAYMAPEQWEDDPEDERTDVFALGVMLYRMLSGEFPFPEGEGRWSAGPAAAPKLDVPGAPGLAELVDRMLEKAPKGRPRDGAAVLAALTPIEDALRTKPADGAPPGHVRRRKGTLGERLSGKIRRRLLGVVAVVGLVAVLAAGGWFLWKQGPVRQGGASPGAQPSIAVLPFADLSPGHDQESLADGVAEEVLNGLAQVDGLRVIGRSTSFSYKGKGKKVEEIGRELGVGSVLEGSVRRSGDKVRITAQLVRTRDASALWSRSFERSLSDVFAVQDEIGRDVVDALAVRLLPGRSSGRAGGTTNPEALQLYLRGRDLLRRGASELPKALEAFEQAVTADPRFALAWVGIADASVTIEATGAEVSGEPGARRRRAHEAADVAVGLAPGLADAFRARSDVRQWLEADWRGQREDVERARALAPGDSAVALSGGFSLLVHGRADEAVAEFERVTRIDPLLERGWVSGWLGLAAAAYSRGDHGKSRQAAGRMAELFPGYRAFAMVVIAMDRVAAGEASEALATAGEFRAMGPPGRPWALLVEALAHHDLGRPADAARAREDLAREFGAFGPYQVAQTYAWAGNADAAFTWLEKARTFPDTAMFWLKTDPLLRKVRGDPRWAELLRRAELPPDGQVPAEPPPLPATPSIAVLPFADLSEKHDQEYFADGVAEEILNALAQVKGLKVIGRTSSFSFRGKADDLRVIGQKLGVANVLEGSLRKDGGQIRIAAKLVRASDGVQLWSESYDRELVGIFQIQDEIAGAVATALQVRLFAADRSAPRSHDPDAYASYLLGRQILSRMTSEELSRAVASFEKAVAIEPTFAEAWAGLSLALDERSGWQSSLEGILRNKRKALDAANRAVELAPGVGAGYAARAQLVDIRGWDWQGSIADARRAVELDPGDVQARIVLGGLLSRMGKAEATQELRRATELDPLSTLAWSQLGLAAGLAGDRTLWEAANARAREINPRNDWRTLVGEGSKEWAEAVLREPVGPLDGHIHYQRVRALRVLGREAEARAALDELMACCSFSGAWQVALAYDNAHERDRAFEWLERARVNMDRGIRYLKTAPRFKGDPRTAEILRKMNLPAD